MHDETEGLAEDLPRLMGRRGVMLTLLGLGAAGLALAQTAPPPVQTEPNLYGPGNRCLKTPTETNGPYPADGSNSRDGSVLDVLAQEGVIRDDLRPSFGALQGRAEGIPMTLEITLTDMSCQPMAGRAVYLWHADAAGKYSLYDLPQQNYLRGVVISDAQGIARVTTIVPGCYDGRWPHIHFEVYDRLTEKPRLTSQFALPKAQARLAYADPRYPESLSHLDRITLTSDTVFGDNTAEQISAQTLGMTNYAKGYAATVTVSLA